MQGWAKRWFRLSPSGVLSYSTSPTGVPRGLIQIRISTITHQPKSRTIHIDSGTMIYHLKALTPEDHETWTKHLKKHRASGLETEVESFEEWRHKRQSRHVSAIAKEKAKIDINRGLQGSQQVKEKLECLDQWIQKGFANNHPDEKSTWMARLVQLKDDLEIAIERQDQQWSVVQETVLQGDPFNLNRSSGASSPLSTVSHAVTTVNPLVNDESSTSGLRRSTTIVSHDSTFSDEFYDAEDAVLSLSEEENDGGENEHVEEAADTTEDDEEEEEEEEEEQERHENQQENKDWTQQVLECPHRRHRLPSPAVGDVGSALSVFRKNVGKDLSTIAMPVSMNEPLNILQKACEELEYSELLDKACLLSAPMERLMYITIFAISSYTSSQYRTGRKPFNPMMTETYENIRPDKGFRFISEKVSHNPLIIAAHAESKNYKYWQCTKIKSKFWGKSMEFMTEGVYHVNLTGHDDHYTYSKPSSWMRNMIAGEKYLEHAGEMKVTNHTTGDYAIVTFKEGTGGGLFGAPTNRNDIIATFYTSNNKKVRRVVGKWSDKLAEEVDMNKRQLSVLWTANSPGVENYADYYGFTRYCMELNEITTLEKDKLPITDTRYRPDQHLYELGRVDEADAEKQRIEQKQRERRKEFEQKGIPWKPRWFALQQDQYNEPDFITPDGTVGESWVFTNQYWNARESGQWPKDMFSLW
ncbi:Oxysterol-binding protein-domain-containing protein [Halteromyces radiatus]|uniref:Oxysterol-binding protein-domain-containing protein n=1 Tax=Halteromyces radiatus TaxID=101107 RepID=UPI002220FEDC|nr:Oxysterol-binding protein-domain-containing protein [Halteromyces radiatus]KAI8093758.1 Oxysterol-binding protein-domain-containing protein [Halteromyces radiatus]